MTTRLRAKAWIGENPTAFGLFEKFALGLAERGRSFGINLIRERVRWETTYEHGGELKFPNEFSPYIARDLIERHPHLAGHMKCKPTKDERPCSKEEATPSND